MTISKDSWCNSVHQFMPAQKAVPLQAHLKMSLVLADVTARSCGGDIHKGMLC